MPTPRKSRSSRRPSARLEGVRGVYLADFSGMDVESLSRLRQKCREQQVQFRVVKNTLLKRAFHERGITALDPFLEGPTGVVFSQASEVSPAKILTDFAKDKERPRIKAAVVDGRLYDAEGGRRAGHAAQLRGDALAVAGHPHRADDDASSPRSTPRCVCPSIMADVLEREKSKAS